MSEFFRIPVKKQTAQQRIQVELSGRTFIIDLTWIARESAWMLDLFDANLTPLILCKFCSDESNVLQDQEWDARIPPGALGMFSDVPGVKPDFNNLGNEVNLFYFER